MFNKFQKLDELYEAYDKAMDQGDILAASKIHETITAIENVCDECTTDDQLPRLFNKGDVVGVYENGCWITVTLDEFVYENGGYEKWLMTTFYGEKIERYVMVNGKNRYSLVNEGLDMYVWDNVMRKTVATATFEREYWVKINGDMKVYEQPSEWDIAIKEYFNIN